MCALTWNHGVISTFWAKSAKLTSDALVEAFGLDVHQVALVEEVHNVMSKRMRWHICRVDILQQQQQQQQQQLDSLLQLVHKDEHVGNHYVLRRMAVLLNLMLEPRPVAFWTGLLVSSTAPCMHWSTR